MTLFDIIALLLVLSALFGFLNNRVLRLPHTIGLMVIALVSSLGLLAIDAAVPGFGIADTVRGALLQIDFSAALMEGMLSALLFAGAVHVDLSELAERKWTIGILASVGVLASTFMVGTAAWYLMAWLGVPIPYIWALIFGALISPTDPVAVLSILKDVSVPKQIESKIAGESLFNDGVGVVVFTILVAIAVGGEKGDIGPLVVAELFVVEALGGAVLGLVAGYVAYAAMRVLDEHNLEVLITLALVTGAYAVALQLTLSGPIAVVVAGLFIGNHGARFAMSDNTREHVFQFWELADEILNSVLFLLIGLEVLVVGWRGDYALVALIAIPMVVLVRWITVAVPVALLSVRRQFVEGTIALLTWGGLRGGISVALALSLPAGPAKEAILAVTYVIVIFSIVVQGLTMKPLARRMVRVDPPDNDELTPRP
jgi:CPA1 family monovalent cation:H+ antiporter